MLGSDDPAAGSSSFTFRRSLPYAPITSRDSPSDVIHTSMGPTARIAIQILIAAALGAGYGLWGLEAVSPLAIPLILWAVLVLLLAWRLPPRFALFIGCVGAFVVGFGVVWTVVLGHLLATCQPPNCQTADAMTDFFYAAALLIPLIVVGSALFAARKLVVHR